MTYRIGKIFEIESGHILSKHPGKCRFPHGHSRRVEVVLAADTLDANDMVCDFKAVKLALQAFLDSWDHALAVNTDDPNFAFYQAKHGERLIPFAHTDPTTEVMAQTIYAELARALAGPTDKVILPLRRPCGSSVCASLKPVQVGRSIRISA